MRNRGGSDEKNTSKIQIDYSDEEEISVKDISENSNEDIRKRNYGDKPIASLDQGENVDLNKISLDGKDKSSNNIKFLWFEVKFCV